MAEKPESNATPDPSADKAPQAAGSKVLTKGQILAADDLETKDVPVPQWGGIVRIRQLTAKERTEWEMFIRQMQEKKLAPTTLGVRLVVMSCIDPETKQLLFDQKDEAELARKSATAMQIIAQYALALNKMRESDVREAVTAFTKTPDAD